VQGWFFAHFPDLYSVDDSSKYISNYPITVKWEIQRGHRERKTYHTLLDRIEMDDVCWGRMKKTWRFRSLRRYFGIQAVSCAALKRYIGSCMSELNGSTDTCRTSIYLRHMLLKCGIMIFCKLSSTFVSTPLWKIVGVIRQEICHD